MFPGKSDKLRYVITKKTFNYKPKYVLMQV
jgi:hypothetical protein